MSIKKRDRSQYTHMVNENLEAYSDNPNTLQALEAILVGSQELLDTYSLEQVDLDPPEGDYRLVVFRLSSAFTMSADSHEQSQIISQIISNTESAMIVEDLNLDDEED